MNKKKSKSQLLKKPSLTASAAVMIGLFTVSSAAFAETEEQRLIRIAKNLKPISDTQWNEIAGPKISETYDIQKGDTLWDISKRLFGNAYYWPKVWSFNVSITNPHVVAPGEKLNFVAGSSEKMPKLAPQAQGPEGTTSNAASDSGATASSATTGSESPSNSGPHEYDKLPLDRWAPIEVETQLTKKYDEYGLDKELKIQIPQKFSFRVPAIANDTTIPYLGEIVGSRREGVGLSEHETVFIRSASQDLQVGVSYAVLNDAEFARDPKSDRSAYIYQVIGEIKIIGVKDDLYIGTIERSYDVLKRGNRLYPMVPQISQIKPIPAQTALESMLVMSNESQTKNTAQYRFVHFDRGIEDGVQIGNVFRVYEYHDPESRQKLTDADFLVSADILVIHATAQFSTGLILRSRDTLSRGDFGVLLTDVSDLDRQLKGQGRDFGTKSTHSEGDRELDELDALDRASGEGLGSKEEQEIKELDHWDKTKDLQSEPSAEPTLPSDAEVPTDQVEKPPAPTDQEPSLSPDSTLDQGLDSPSASGPESTPPMEPEQTLDAPQSQSGEPTLDEAPPTEAPTEGTPAADMPAASAEDPGLDTPPPPPEGTLPQE